MATSLPPGETKLREAGLLEKFHLIRVDGGFDTCVVSAVKYTGPPLTRPSVLRALRHIVNTHAALSVYATSPPPPTGTTKTNDKKHDPFEINFHRLPNVLVDDVLTLDAYSGKTLEEALHAELEKPPPKLVKEGVKTETEFERPKPLWRVSILDDKQTVIFALHHAIGDGASGFALQRTFLDGLNGPSTDVDEVEEGTVIDPPTDLHLTPPIESRTSVAVTWRTFFSIMYQTFAPKSWLKGYAAWTGNLVGSSTDAPVAPDTRVQVRLRKIEGEEGKKLVKVCRKNGTTVTAFLHTLGVAVWSDVLRTSKDAGLESEIGMRWKTLSTSIPVSLRRFTGATPFEMCDHVSNYHFYPSIRADHGSIDNETFPWEEAQKLAKELKSGLEGTKQVVGTIRYMFSLGIAWGFFKGQVGKKRNYTFEVSNVGVLPKSQVAIEEGKAQWDAEEVWHAQNDGVCGAAVKMNVAGASESGTIAIVYTWGEGAVDTSLADRFVEGVHEGIRAILEGE